MNLKLSTKLLLSYIVIILVTLILLEVFIRWQVTLHFNELYEQIRTHQMGFPVKPGDFKPGLNFLDVFQSSLFYTILAAGTLAIVLSVVFTRAITGPIHDVIEATKAIAKGNYSLKMPKKSSDELGELSESLNVMAQALDDNRYLQRQLITNVSHELATPLTNIGGYLEALIDGVIPDKKRKATLALMKEEADRLKQMVQEVRTLAMIQEPQFKVSRSEVDIKKLVQKVVKQCEPSFQAAKVPLTARYQLKQAKHFLDSDRIHQIVLNLINNALTHSQSKKPVELIVDDSDGKLKIQVRDHGIGIPEKELPYIFERFYRVDTSRSRQSGGIGIGLAIVKELVEAHGGKVAIKSGVGEGTEFTCEFPITQLS